MVRLFFIIQIYKLDVDISQKMVKWLILCKIDDLS